jgi:hypothetical protein
MQLNLSFMEIAEPIQQVWDELDDEQRQAAIDRLSRLITKTALTSQFNEEDTDE